MKRFAAWMFLLMVGLSLGACIVEDGGGRGGGGGYGGEYRHHRDRDWR